MEHCEGNMKQCSIFEAQPVPYKPTQSNVSLCSASSLDKHKWLQNAYVYKGTRTHFHIISTFRS